MCGLSKEDPRVWPPRANSGISHRARRFLGTNAEKAVQNARTSGIGTVFRWIFYEKLRSATAMSVAHPGGRVGETDRPGPRHRRTAHEGACNQQPQERVHLSWKTSSILMLRGHYTLSSDQVRSVYQDSSGTLCVGTVVRGQRVDLSTFAGNRLAVSRHLLDPELGSPATTFCQPG